MKFKYLNTANASYSFLLIIFVFFISPSSANAQAIYVSPADGHEVASGTKADPLNTLGKAVALASTFSGREPVTIKLEPGLYVLDKQILINPFPGITDTVQYTIEAQIMPDDTSWQPAKMPVIQSVSANNKDYGHFNHCIGFQVERNNVCFRGLKFIGNANTSVDYFYVIERHNPELDGLSISQCYFIGDKNAAPIQGGLFVQGGDFNVDHCIFYGCKNAILTFAGIKNFSLTHSIIYGSYEGAFWYGYNQTADVPFTFRDNIVAACNYFFVGYRGIHDNYSFSNSLITDNRYYMGFNGEQIKPDMENKPKEDHIVKSGTVFLNEVTLSGTPSDYLQPSPVSAGRDIDAGIFKKLFKGNHYP
ncbi:MAG TPA: hypothetical protein VGI38_05330 [Puia sp.]|jgi:hypothetical protein